MPFKFHLRRAKRYTVSSKNAYVVCVHLLDNNLIECTLNAESTGQECLENIAQRTDLSEIEYFGLRYVTKKLQFQWVELDKPLKKQLDKHAHSPMLYFGVMFYVAKAHEIKDTNVRFQFYMQLKSDVIDCKFACSRDQAVVLAAYSVQAELGDHDYEQHTAENFKDLVLLPRSMTSDDQVLTELTQKIVQVHRTLQGLSPVEAENHYLMKAELLEGYGLDYYPAKDVLGGEVLLGVCYRGIYIRHQNGAPTQFYKWGDVSGLAHSRKTFGLETSMVDKPLHYQMDDPEMAKYVHKMCSMHVAFFKSTDKISIGEKTSITGNSSFGTIPDIQKCSQPSLESQESVSRSTPPPATESPKISDVETGCTVPSGGESIMMENSYPATGYGEPQYANGGVFNLMHSEPHHVQQYLQSVAPSPPPTATSYVSRLQELPSYRQTPDYDAVMQQRLRQQLQNPQASQNLQTTLQNLSHTQVYTHPEAMAYSQPEIGNTTLSYYPNSSIYQSPLVDMRGGDASYHHQITRPVDRTSSLIIHPTYSTPELGLPNEMSISENRINEMVLNYRLPPQYARPSSSTPDLATQTVRRNYPGNPDLLQRMPVTKTPLVMQSRLDQSLDNLAVDTQQKLHLHQSSAERMGLEGRASPYSDSSTGQGKVCLPDIIRRQAELPDMSAVHLQNMPNQCNVAATNYSGMEGLSVRLNACSDTQRGYERPAESIPPYHDLQHLKYYETPSDNEVVECLDTSNYSSGDQLSSQGHSKNSSLDMPVSLLPDQMQLYAQHLSSQSMNRGQMYGQQFSLAQDSSPQNASLTSTLTQQSSQVEVSPQTNGIQGNIDNQEEDEEKNKRLSLGPLKLAAMNGLSISRGNILDFELEPHRENPLPKDERRKDFENKLEEGQVFVEFEHIPKKQAKAECQVAAHAANRDRNKFKDVLPYDHNRVKLLPTKDNPHGYINASHIKLNVASEDLLYIAAQAPMANTMVDFWQMIWEHDVDVIAMLTGIQEYGRPKSHPYWPDDIGVEYQVTYGEYQVTLQFSTDSGTYMTRGLRLYNKKVRKDRLVWHLQYTQWPDRGCPDDAQGFLSYLDEIGSVRRHTSMERKESRKNPVLVHCSAGVGRTGVFILAEVMQVCLEHNEGLEIATVLWKLREQRMYMVQTVSQYSFVYTLLIHYLKSSRLI